MKGFSRLCQHQDFHGVHLSGQNVREESGGNMEEVIWLSHPGVRCQTWHSSFSNYYNMLNLLSSPPGRKFFKKEPDLHFSCMLRIQKKLFKPRWGVNWNSNSPSSHTAACYKRQAFNLVYRAFLQLTKLWEWKGAFMRNCTKLNGTNCHRRGICDLSFHETVVKVHQNDQKLQQKLQQTLSKCAQH